MNKFIDLLMQEGWKICNFYFVVTENEVNVLICAIFYRTNLQKNKISTMFSFHQLTVGLLNTVYPSNLKDKEGNRIGGLYEKIVYRQMLF